MSLRTPANAFKRMRNEAYYTPLSAVTPLADFLDGWGLLQRQGLQIWECAAGAGYVAKALAKHTSMPIFASDLFPPPEKKLVWPVAPLNFLNSTGPSGHALAIITNPPYGKNSEQALAFITHGLDLIAKRGGYMALLLPFEFDSRASRDHLIGSHPIFAAKLTLGTRVRWLNLPQSHNSPMGHHAWFIWSTLFHDRHARVALRVI